MRSGARVIVGRDEKENSIISAFAGEEDLLMEVVGFGSPIALLKGSHNERDVKIAASICARYSDCDSGIVEVRIETKGNRERSIFVEPLQDEYLERFRIE